MDFNALRTIVSPAAISLNWTEAQTAADPYMGEVLFPRQQKAGLDLSWYKGAKGLPISLMPSAFDAKATYRDRMGVAKLESEMPFFREGFKIKEKDRQNILRAMDTNDPYVREIIGNIFDDAAQLIEGARVVGERMRMQLLFAENGNVGISIVANGVDYTYNYDPNGTWKSSNYFALTGQDMWTDKDHSDPLVDIQQGKDAVSDKGGKSTMMAMNSNTLRTLRGNKALLNRFVTSSGIPIAVPTDADMLKVLRDSSELEIVVYDKKFQNENKQTKKFVPDGYVALLPDGALGTTYLGTTPEEADLLSSNVADVSIVDTGVAVTQIVEPHPVNINTIVSEIILPSYEQMDQVALLKVY